MTVNEISLKDRQALADRFASSPFLEKLREADSIEVDNAIFCRHFALEEEEFDAEDILDTSVSDSELYEMMTSVLAEVDVVGDEFEKYEYFLSVWDILLAAPRDDGGYEVRESRLVPEDGVVRVTDEGSYTVCCFRVTPI